MLRLRITKYNPIFRDRNGIYSYSKEEWTSVCDIGKIFNGRVFTTNEYIAVENAYVNTVMAFVDELKITSLKVRGLEIDEERLGLDKLNIAYSRGMKALLLSIRNDYEIGLSQIKNLCRLVLRECMWCKLENDPLMFVHFGYDYYMYIGSEKICTNAIGKAVKMGLYVEECRSPYEIAES